MFPTKEELMLQGWRQAKFHGQLHLVPPVKSEKCKALMHIVYMIHEDGISLTRMMHRLDDADVGDDDCECCCALNLGQCHGGAGPGHSGPSAWCPNGVADADHTCTTVEKCEGGSSTPAPGTPTPAPGAPTPAPLDCSGVTGKCWSYDGGTKMFKCGEEGNSATGWLCEVPPRCKEYGPSAVYYSGGEGCPSIVDMDQPQNAAISYIPSSFKKKKKKWSTLSDGPKTTAKNIVYVMLDTAAKYKVFNNLVDTLLSKKKKSPWDRFVIGFFRPDMDYSNYTSLSNTIPTLGGVSQFYASEKDTTTYQELQTLIHNINKIPAPNMATMEVYLSMGGWNFNCVPLFYTNSFASVEVQTSNREWSEDKPHFGNKCEPKNAMGKTADKINYTFFPDPAVDDDTSTDIFSEADASSGGGGSYWKEMITNDMYRGWSIRLTPNGKKLEDQQWPLWTNNGTTGNLIPVQSHAIVGNDKFPGAEIVYTNFVYMASAVGANGVDLDYEEFWHADSFHDTLPVNGLAPPYNSSSHGLLSRTKAKLVRISLMLKWACLQTQSGKSTRTTMGLSIPAPAVAVSPGPWYYGNLKGLFLDDIYFSWAEYISRATGLQISDNLFNKLYDGGVCPMIYDLGGSGNDCVGPNKTQCSLQLQLPYYKKQFDNAKISTYIPFEVGRPAYPQTGTISTVNNKTLPPSKTDVSNILNNSDMNTHYTLGAFYWELFKGPGIYTNLIKDKCCIGNCPDTIEIATGDYISEQIYTKWSKNKYLTPLIKVGSATSTTIPWKKTDESYACQYNQCGCDFSATCLSGDHVCWGNCCSGNTGLGSPMYGA